VGGIKCVITPSFDSVYVQMYNIPWELTYKLRNTFLNVISKEMLKFCNIN